jgi:hypothetical protein
MADLIPVHALVNGAVILHYFRTSDVYGESGGLGDKVGIKKIREQDLTGNEEIVPVKELLRSGAMQRIGIRYKNTFGFKRSAKILVNQVKLSGIFDDSPTGRLEGTDYKVGAELVARGQISNIGQIRRASFY